MDKRVEAIWTDLHQELERFIFLKVKDADTAKDILQDVFVKIIAHLPSLKDETKLTSWVYAIVRNGIADFQRTKNREIEWQYLHENEAEEPSYERLSDCINQKIAQLPEKYKQAITALTFEDFSQIELAEKLNLPYSTAKSRSNAAKTF